jgi:AbrB family looped-hinge helix DNA binding protein
MLRLKSKIGPKGQVVIPKAVRDSFGLKPGGTVYFYTKEDEIMLQKKSDEEVLEELFSGERIRPPKSIDWDRVFYSQFEE